MSLRIWDEKAQNLRSEMLTLLAQQGKKQAQVHLKLAAKMKRLKKWQFRLEKDLSFVHSLTGKNLFLAMQEKTLLHWARDFTTKTHSLYQQYTSAIHTLLWARLVHMRSMSLTVDNRAATTEATHSDLIDSYQQQLQQTRTKMESYLQSLSEKKAALRLRYEYLVVNHINREAQDYLRQTAPAQLTTARNLLTRAHSTLGHRQGKTSLQSGYTHSSEDQKLARLAISLSPPPRPPAPASRLEKKSFQNVDHLLRKFDYMNLEESLQAEKEGVVSAKLFSW